MNLGITVTCMVPLCHSSAIFPDLCFNLIALFIIRYFDLTRLANQPFILWFRWPPFSTISTSGSLRKWKHISISFYNNTTVLRQRQFSGYVFHIGRRCIIRLVFPGGKFIVNINDISFHLRERCMIAQDSFRLDPGKHFPVTLQEEFLLVSTIVMCRYHVSGNRHCASLWNPKKAKIDKF